MSEPTSAPVYYAPARPNNILAILSLVASCVSVILPGANIAGIIMGHIALVQIKRTGEGGHGLALAGVIIGYCVTGIAILVVIAYIVVLVAFAGFFAANADQFKNFG